MYGKVYCIMKYFITNLHLNVYKDVTTFQNFIASVFTADVTYAVSTISIKSTTIIAVRQCVGEYLQAFDTPNK